MIRLRGIALALGALVAVQAASAQVAAPIPPSPVALQDQTTDGADTPIPPASPGASKPHPLSFSGVVDGYYSLSLNHPANQLNGLQNFDDKANGLDLNMALLTVDYAPGPVGFHLDAGVGRAFDIMGAAEKDVTGMRYFQQAYIDIKPPSWKGLELDFGKFASAASAEVIETPGNWNYSRSLLFVWCTPHNLFGVRASTPLGNRFSMGAQLVAGWNNIVTGATYRTVGWTGSWAPSSRVTWTNTYYGGPDENKADRGRRDLYDSVLLLSPSAKINLYLNLDYLQDSPKRLPAYRVYGAAAAARFVITRRVTLSPRLEWLNDRSGGATGVGQQVKEFTLTGTYALLDFLSAWLEFRDDWSNQPFFSRGGTMAPCGRQPTLLAGLVAVFAPKK